MRRRDFLTGLAVIANGIASARMSNAQAPRKMVRRGFAFFSSRTNPLVYCSALPQQRSGQYPGRRCRRCARQKLAPSLPDAAWHLHRQSIARATGILVLDASNRNAKACPAPPLWTRRTRLAKHGATGPLRGHLSKMFSFWLRIG
jgi:hypothetical protein